ncbi:MAG: putative secreted protein [Myxococcales bacterium]|nr:putative secreted protein [Myxococcales bacterium]
MTNIDLRTHLTVVITLIATMAAPGAAAAQTISGGPVEVVSAAPSSATLTPATLPPYSLPWQLRPVTTGNVLRIDSAAAVFNDVQGNVDIAVTSVVAASYQLTPHWAPMVRLGFVGNNAPGAALDGSSFVNPLVGATYTKRTESIRLGLFGATTIPVGSGGGNAPNGGAAKTDAAAPMARPADDVMFAVDYVTEIVGADVAYVNHGLTAQAEATLMQSIRVRGNDSAGGTDRFRTNSSVGFHLGYFMGSHFSLGGDLRYQRWLSHPTTLDELTGAPVPLAASKINTVTVAVGPRLHFRLGKHAWIRPGVSYVRGLDARGFDAPLITAQTTAVMIDVPVIF